MSIRDEFKSMKKGFSDFKEEIMKLKELSENAKQDALETCEEIAEVASEGLTWLKNEVDSFREYLKYRNEEKEDDTSSSE